MWRLAELLDQLGFGILAQLIVVSGLWKGLFELLSSAGLERKEQRLKKTAVCGKNRKGGWQYNFDSKVEMECKEHVVSSQQELLGKAANDARVVKAVNGR